MVKVKLRYILLLIAFVLVSFQSVFAETAPLQAKEEAVKNLRDPTTPLMGVVASKRKSLPVLQAIIERDGKRYAIVAGKTVVAGDKVSGVKVADIGKTWVNYEVNGKLRQVSLRRNITGIKKKTN